MAGKPLDPGPPLTPDPEFCESDPPSTLQWFKAAGAAGLILLGGAAAWAGVVVATQHLWGFTTVFIGVAAGWAVNRASGMHRSIALGAVAGAVTVLASLAGYGLLWLPFLGSLVRDRQLRWYDLIIAALGAFVAYLLAGPRRSDGVRR